MAASMYLDVFDRNPYGTNCWLLGAGSSGEAIVVDPGFDPEAIHGLLAKSSKTPVAVLLTHAHADHAAEAGVFAGGEIPVLIHPADAVAYDDPDRWAGGPGSPLTPAAMLRTIADGEVLGLAGLSIEVRHTPGHTPGHCCFRVDGDLLICSGDLVFAGSIGRSDFANSDQEAMRASLEWFLTLPDELDVLPGHGARTTVGNERATNPFFARLA